MRVLFLTSLCLVLFYIVFKRRKFDFFSIFAVSAYIYMYPGIEGRLFYYYTSISNTSEEVIPLTYLCLSIFNLLLLCFTVINDNFAITKYAYDSQTNCEDKSQLNNDVRTNISVSILSAILIVMGIYTLTRYSISSGNYDKVAFLQNSNKLTTYFKYGSLYVFVYSYINTGERIKTARILGTLCIIVTFLLGHRSFIVLGLIAIIEHNFHNSEATSISAVIKKHKKFFILGLLSALFFLFVKNVFFDIVDGNFEAVKVKLSDPLYYSRALEHSEANTIMLNLQNVCKYGTEFGLEDYLGQFIYMIPVIGNIIGQRLGIKSFDRYLNEAFNPLNSEGVGLGNTYLGEAYSIGGLLSFGIILLVTMSFVLWLNKRRDFIRNSSNLTLSSVLLSYFTFYLFRNSSFDLLLAIRSYIYIWIAIVIIKMFLRSGKGRTVC